MQPVYPIPPHCPYNFAVQVLVAALEVVVLVLLTVEVDSVVVLVALVELLVVLALELVVVELVVLTLVEDALVVVVLLPFVEVVDDPPPPLTVPEA